MNYLTKPLIFAAALLLHAHAIAANETHKTDKPRPNQHNETQAVDQKAITQAVLDYVEGWYTSDSKRMDRALSEHLVKRRITADGEVMAVSKEWMVRETGNGRGQIDHPEKGRKAITILAQTNTIASVQLLSEEYVDYLHLAKIDGRWKIVHALWEYQ